MEIKERLKPDKKQMTMFAILGAIALSQFSTFSIDTFPIVDTTNPIVGWIFSLIIGFLIWPLSLAVYLSGIWGVSQLVIFIVLEIIWLWILSCILKALSYLLLIILFIVFLLPFTGFI